MMIKVNYDTDGKILGFYIQGMHANIPEPTLEITEKQHAEYFNQGQNYKVVDGIFMYVEPEGPTAAEIKKQQYATINDTYSVKLEGIVAAIARLQAQPVNEIITAKIVSLQELYKTTQTEWKNAILAVI